MKKISLLFPVDKQVWIGQYQLLSKHTKQTITKIRRDTERDNFMDAEEALAYGIVDKILKHRDTKS